MARSMHRGHWSARLLTAWVVLVVLVSFSGIGFAAPSKTSGVGGGSTEETAAPVPVDPPAEPVIEAPAEETPDAPEEVTDAEEAPAVEEAPAPEAEAPAEEGAPVEKAAAAAPAVVTPATIPSYTASELGVWPVYVAGNPTCTEHDSINIDGSAFHNGTYTTGLPAGASITISDYRVGNLYTGFDFDAQGVIIQGVIVKASEGANTYSYASMSGVSGDGNLQSVIKNGHFTAISHVIFCYTIAPSRGHIIVRKYQDLSGNGMREGGEPWLAGFDFKLYKGDSSTGPWHYEKTVTSTGMNGEADFGNYIAGWYKVVEALSPAQVAAGWVCTSGAEKIFFHTGEVNGQSGDDETKWFGNSQTHEKTFSLTYEGAVPPDTTFLVTYKLDGVTQAPLALTGSGPFKATVELNHGAVISDVNWYAVWGGANVLLGSTRGETLTRDKTNSFTYGAQIDGYKYEDLDADSVKDGGEPGLSGWTIVLERQSDGKWLPFDTRVTDASGFYKFYSPIPGEYRISEVLKAGWNQSAPAGGYHYATISAIGGGTASIACVGTQVHNKNFLNWRPATIEGSKFNDNNMNGEWDENELGLAGVTIFVDYNGNGSLDAGEPFDVTDTAGHYSIDDVRPGRYWVLEVVPADWYQTAGDFQVCFVSGHRYVDGYDFGNYTTIDLSGYKWHDMDRDGVWDGTEPGLEGWKITIEGRDAAGAPVILSTFTGSDGSYSFDDLLPGDYTVSEELVAGWTQSYPAAGTHQVTLESGMPPVTDVDFGNWTTSSVEGYKFEDLNGNGVNDDEPGLESWTVFVDYDNDGALDAGEPSDVSDSNGYWKIENVTPGTYHLREVMDREGWAQSRGDFLVQFTSGGELGGDGQYDFGNWEYTRLSGYKFLDKNANGEWDEGEDTLVGWEIHLTGTNGMGEPVNLTTYTDDEGYYEFTELAPGSYTVSEVVTEGYTQSYPAEGTYDVILASGDRPEMSYDFGNWSPIDPNGYKFHDLNANGVWDQGEPTLAGWEIHIDGTTGWGEPVSEVTTTDENGYFDFPEIAPGEYTISEVQQSGWTQSYPANGDYELALYSGMDPQSGFDFGNWLPAEMSGYKFYDANGDGQARDEGEIGLEGWTMYVDYNNDWTLDEGEPFAVTDSTGYYHITGIHPGQWHVRELFQEDWQITYPAMWAYNLVFISDGSMTGDFGNTTQVTKTFDLTYVGDAPEGTTFSVSFDTTRTLYSPPPEPVEEFDVTPSAVAIQTESHEIDLVESAPGVYTADYAIWPQTTLGNVQWWAHWNGEDILLGTGDGDELITAPITNSFEYNADVNGSKWNDTDQVSPATSLGQGDGIWDKATEPGIAGWTIQLYRRASDQSWQLYATTVTGADGAYSFTGLLPGVYYASEVIPVAAPTEPQWFQSAGPAGEGEGAFEVADDTSQGPIDFGNWLEQFAPLTLDMSLVKSVDKATATAGDTLTYTLTYKMVTGAILADTPFTIVDDYDETYATVVDAAGGTVANGKITWTLVGPLANGESKSITYKLKLDSEMPTSTTYVDNTAVVTLTGDSNPDNNTDSARVTVAAEGEPFLPYTGGDAAALLAALIGAVALGAVLRRYGRRTV